MRDPNSDKTLVEGMRTKMLEYYKTNDKDNSVEKSKEGGNTDQRNSIVSDTEIETFLVRYQARFSQTGPGAK